MQQSIQFPDKLKGYSCPCCSQFVKVYTRSFNSNMLFALLHLYKNQDKGFIHLENSMIEAGHKRSGDASYLRWYGFIEGMKAKREDGSKRNGMYKITGRGILACELKITFQSKFLIFNNRLEGFEGLEVNLSQCLDKKFNYSNLMLA
jgi:hypothetical protein